MKQVPSAAVHSSVLARLALLAFAACAACGRIDFGAAHVVAGDAGSNGALVCEPGWGDCDHVLSNGCETQLDQDTACGACGTHCQCASGACVGPFTCAPGFADCDGDPSNGCEADLSSPLDCVDCHVRCDQTSVCTANGCVACPDGFADCDGNSANGCETNILNGDYNNCGMCGYMCSGPTVCRAGQCY